MAEQNTLRPNPIIIKGDSKAAKLGDRFEILILTHFAIICVLDEDYNGKNPRITYNAEDHGNLDDVVILTDDELILVQLKHKLDRGNIIIKYADYERTYNNIILPKYKQQIKNGLKITVIVFSNAKVVTPKVMKVIQANKSKLNKFNALKCNGEIFQLQNRNASTSEFFKNLYVFSEQFSATQDFEMLSNNFETKLDKEQIKAIFDYFDRAVVKRTEPFTKNEILSVLNECILKPSIIFDDNSYFYLNDSFPISLFETVLQNNKLLIVTEEYKKLFITLIRRHIIYKSECNFTTKYKDEIPQNDLDKLFNDGDLIKQLAIKKTPLTFEDLSVALWQVGKCPILVDYNKRKSQIDYCINKIMIDEGPIIMIINKNQTDLPKNAATFDNLSLFENANPETKDQFVEKMNIKIGPNERKLKDVIGKEYSSLDKIKPNILLCLLNNSLTINESTMYPEIYIPRKLETTLVTESIFDISDVLFVIHRDPSKLDLEKYLKHQSRYENVTMVNSKWSLRRTKEKATAIEKKYCCLVKYGNKYKVYDLNNKEHSKNKKFDTKIIKDIDIPMKVSCTRDLKKVIKFKWKIEGGIGDLRPYSERTKVDEDEIINSPELLVKVISADAGMGKTFLVEHQLQRKLFEMGKLPIYFNLGLTYEEMNKLTRNTYIKYLATHLENDKENKEKIEFLECAIEYNVKKKNVVLLLDGFDEAKLDYNVINLFLSLDMEIVITTRTHEVQKLLDTFICLHFSLLSFTQPDQHQFFKCSYKNEDSEQIKEMIRVLNTNVQESLMGIPLQIKHVVDIFPKINDFLIMKEEVNILFLYETFIEKHLKQCSIAKRIYINKFACATLLSSSLLQSLQIDEEELFETKPDFEHDNKNNFILTGFDSNDKPRFVHKTYAEFLCAHYLTKRKRLSVHILDQLLMMEGLLKVRYFFDLILSKNLKLHFALLTNDCDQIEIHSNDEKSLNEIDKFGRNILHIASTYGERHTNVRERFFMFNATSHPYLRKKRLELTIYEEMIIRVLEKIKEKDMQFSKDNWNNDPFAYAIKTRSYNVLELFISFLQGKLPIKNEKVATELIFAAALYDYQNIFNTLYKSELYNEIIAHPNFHCNISLYFNIHSDTQYSLINICAQYGSKKMVETLLENKLFKINERYNAGGPQLTALETAVEEWMVSDENQEKYSSLISMLIEKGAKDINCDENTAKVLHKLAQKIDLDSNNLINSVLSKFLKSHDGKYINSINSEGQTPLMIASKYAMSNISVQFILTLINFKSNLLCFDKYKCNIWHYLCINPHLDDVNKIIIASQIISCFDKDQENGSNNESEEGITPLMIAIQEARKESTDLIKFLIEHGATLKKDKWGQNIWHYLSLNKSLNNEGLKDGTNTLLSHFEDSCLSGIDDETLQGITPLMFSIKEARNESIDLIKFLIDQGANILKKDKFGLNVWHYLAYNKNLDNKYLIDVANMLMSHFETNSNLNGIDDETEKGITPLMLAIEEARNKAIDLIKFLIDQGANINKKNKLGQNIWYYLASNEYLNEGNKNTIKIFLKKDELLQYRPYSPDLSLRLFTYNQ